MGVASSKYCKGKTAFKRLKLDFHTNFRRNYSDDSNEISPFTYSVWENLPYVALVEIYRCIPNKDKFNLSLTCRAWSRPFSMPKVWRRTKFLFNRIEDWRGVRFARSMASGLRHLVIDCQDTVEMITQSTSGSSLRVYTILDVLLSFNNCRLLTLTLINLGRLSKWYKCNSNRDIAKVLGDVRSSQTDLMLLDLSRAGFSAEQGLYILSQLALRCASTITVLAISEFVFRLVDPRIITWLQAFIELTELTISHQNLPDALLDGLSVCGSLMGLNVFAQVLTDVRQPSGGAWENVTRSRPALEARYCTVNILQNCLRRTDLDIRSARVWADRVLDMIIIRCLLPEEIFFTERGDRSLLQASIEMTVRNALARQQASHLQSLTFNGEEVNLELTLLGLLVDWLLDKYRTPLT